MRLAPHAFTALAAVSVALLAGRVYQPAQAEEVPALTAAQIESLEVQAFAAAAAPAGLTAPEAVPVQIRRGETFEQAVRRTGVFAIAASLLLSGAPAFPTRTPRPSPPPSPTPSTSTRCVRA